MLARCFRMGLWLVAIAGGSAVGCAALIHTGVLAAPGEIAVAWTGHDGQVQRGWISALDVTQFRATAAGKLGPACQDSEAKIKQAAAEHLAPVFTAVAQRVPDYGDWLFSWTPSYARDRLLLGTALSTAYDKLGDSEIADVWPAVERQLQTEVRNSFLALVLAPAQVDPMLAQAWSRAEATTAAVTNELRRGQAQAIQAFAREGARPLWRPTWLPQPSLTALADAGGDPGDASARESWQPAAGDILAAMEDPAAAVLIRAPRPILARGVGVGLRSAIGLSTLDVTRIVVDVTDLGVIAVLPGLGLGLGWAMLTAVGLDFIISKGDELLNRQDFEAELARTLARTHHAVAQDWARRLWPAVSTCAL